MSEKCELEIILDEAVAFMRERLDGREPKVGLVLGTGLNPLGNEISDAVYVPFPDVPHLKASTASGHVGRFVCGMLGGKCVLAMQGRLHGYENNTPQQVAFPIWVMARLGIEVLVATNAAGAINESYRVGDFCIISDHINFTGRNPVALPDTDKLSKRFFSMTDAYDPALRKLAHEVASERGIRVQEGVYLGLLGPSFESPAEIRAFRIWGADTVAMSLCEEVIAARHMRVRVLGISLVSNMAAGVGAVAGAGGASPSGAEVMAAARDVERDFSDLITGIVEQL